MDLFCGVLVGVLWVCCGHVLGILVDVLWMYIGCINGYFVFSLVKQQ